MRRRFTFPASKKEFDLPADARKVVDAVWNVLEAAVALHDADQRMHHAAMPSGDWFSFKSDKPETRDRNGCVVEARINDRWTLSVASRRGLHPDAESIAKWAAEKLAPYLPKSAADDDAVYPPPGGRGGPSGAAEIGIPVWWARKTRG